MFNNNLLIINTINSSLTKYILCIFSFLMDGVKELPDSQGEINKNSKLTQINAEGTESYNFLMLKATSNN